jgi:hypothetical protein
MLYIDQPVSTGFSYSGELVNSTYDLLFAGGNSISDTGIVPFVDYSGSVPEVNATFLHGTFGSQSLGQTADTSVIAARTLWHFNQIWFSHFPHKSGNDKVSFWGNSYGGFWVPTSASYTVSQNAKIRNGTINGTIIEVDTIGYTNGCTDMLYQASTYPDMAYNNTYDLQIIPEDVYVEAKNNFTKAGGCRDQILDCRALGDLYDPSQLGINDTVNEICLAATLYCFDYVVGAFDAYSNRSDFDFAHEKPDPFPSYYTAGFFNQHWVQRELGVPVNFTADSLAVNNVGEKALCTNFGLPS